MSIDKIPLNPSWKSQAGPPVAPCAPLEYAMQPVLDVAVFTVAGTTKPGLYPGAEWYQTFPIPLGVKAVCHSFDMELSTSAAVYDNADESDCIFTGPMVSLGKAYKANRSSQIVGKSLMIADKNGKWVEFAEMPARLTTDDPHRIQIFHTFDFVKEISSTVAEAIDGTLYVVPANLQNVPMTLSDWTDYNQVIVQMQSGLTNDPKAAFSKTVGNMELIWS